MNRESRPSKPGPGKGNLGGQGNGSGDGLNGARARLRRALSVILLFGAVTGAVYYGHFYVPPRPVSAVEATGFDEVSPARYFTVMDEEGEVLFTTGHFVHVGDEYISPDEIRYQITHVEGEIASAVSMGKMEALIVFPSVVGAEVKSGGSRSVAIYHTHSDESYLNGDGADSLPAKGGVFQVGSSLARSLTNKGVKVVHNTTSHDPHDAGAYDRSRRTAAQLLRNGPAALLDVHRDAGPAEPYLMEVPGKGTVAKAMIVVGRTNPRMEANLDFARRLMNAINTKYEGLAKGIFMGKADFNQDLSDKSLLLEMGTEKTPKEAAEKGAALVGEVLPSVLTAGAGPGNLAVGKSIGWILGALVTGVFAYLWVATGSWDEMRAKILGWFGAGAARIGGGRRNGNGGPDGA